MSQNHPKLTPNQKNLIHRYLVWCYKTTKEKLDRIDRKTTQLMVDEFVFVQLQRSLKNDQNQEYQREIEGFSEYMQKKKVDQQNISGAHYKYLQNRFAAIEKSIVYFLGRPEFKKIEGQYEFEMTKRILETREHH